MRKHLTILIALLLLSYASMAQQRVRVVTYNVQSFEGTGGTQPTESFVMAPFIEALQKLDADVIVLNELEIMTGRTNSRDLMSELAGGLGMFAYFGKSYDKESGYYGNAVLSRYPVLNLFSRQIVKPEGSSDQRSVIRTDILLPSGTVVRIIGTHLDHKGGREEQVQDILKKDIFDTSIPTILLGDLNDLPFSDAVKSLEQHFEHMSDLNGATFMSGAKIDYIMASPKGGWQLKESRVVTECGYSDHFPVVSEIELTSKK